MNANLKFPLEEAWSVRLALQYERFNEVMKRHLQVAPGTGYALYFCIAFFFVESFMVTYDSKTRQFFRLHPLGVEPPLPLTIKDVLWGVIASIQQISDAAALCGNPYAGSFRSIDPGKVTLLLPEVALTLPEGKTQAASTLR